MTTPTLVIAQQYSSAIIFSLRPRSREEKIRRAFQKKLYLILYVFKVWLSLAVSVYDSYAVPNLIKIE